MKNIKALQVEFTLKKNELLVLQNQINRLQNKINLIVDEDNIDLDYLDELAHLKLCKVNSKEYVFYY